MLSIAPELAARYASLVLRHVTVLDNGCWVRTSGVNPVTGYSSIRAGRTQYYTHRIMYVFAKGPIPEGETIDHLCRQPACCNPDHLEAVPHRINVLRSNNPAAINARKVECPQGHPLPGPDKDGHRVCVVCRNAHRKQRRGPKRRYVVGPMRNEDPRHGTPNGYTNLQCRCDLCKDAMRQYRRLRQSASRELPGLANV